MSLRSACARNGRNLAGQVPANKRAVSAQRNDLIIRIAYYVLRNTSNVKRQNSQTHAGHLFTGLVDEVSLWDPALSAAEIQSHFADTYLARVIADLTGFIEGLGLSPGTERGLITRLQIAARMVEKNNPTAFANMLKAMVNQLEAQSGKALREPDATYLIATIKALVQQLETNPNPL